MENNHEKNHYYYRKDLAVHRFEFFDGDTKAELYDPRRVYYIRAGIQFGG